MHTSVDLALVEKIDAILPQTQCQQCGFAGCRPYAEAIAAGTADINQCPPGGANGIDELAALLGRDAIALNPHHGVEKPREYAVIDEARCIGCTLCIQACPTDAILGAAKLMHTVIADECTGCALCLAPCPVDCIDMITLAPTSSRLAPAEREHARQRYQFHQFRLAREAQEHTARLANRTASKRLSTATSSTDSATASAANTEPMTVAAQHAPVSAVPMSDAPHDIDEKKQARIAAAMARATALRQPK